MADGKTHVEEKFDIHAFQELMQRAARAEAYIKALLEDKRRLAEGKALITAFVKELETLQDDDKIKRLLQDEDKMKPLRELQAAVEVDPRVRKQQMEDCINVIRALNDTMNKHHNTIVRALEQANTEAKQEGGNELFDLSKVVEIEG